MQNGLQIVSQGDISSQDKSYTIELHRSIINRYQEAKINKHYLEDLSFAFTEEIIEFDREIRGKTVQSRIEIYRPKNISEGSEEFPTIFIIPATGFNTNTLFSKMVWSRIGLDSGYQIIILYHQLAPEYRFPIALYELKMNIQYIVNNRKMYKIDLNNIILAGFSSGGNLATVLLLKNMLHCISIRYLCVISPLLDMQRDEKSIQKDSFPPKLLKQFITWYTKADEKLKRIQLSPINGNFSSLQCPVMIFVGRDDICLIDSKRLYEKIRSCGIHVIKYIHDGKHMAFWENPKLLLKIAEFLVNLRVSPTNSLIKFSFFHIPDKNLVVKGSVRRKGICLIDSKRLYEKIRSCGIHVIKYIHDGKHMAFWETPKFSVKPKVYSTRSCT